LVGWLVGWLVGTPALIALLPLTLKGWEARRARARLGGRVPRRLRRAACLRFKTLQLAGGRRAVSCEPHPSLLSHLTPVPPCGARDQPCWRARDIATAPPLRPFALVAGGPLYQMQCNANRARLGGRVPRRLRRAACLRFKTLQLAGGRRAVPCEPHPSLLSHLTPVPPCGARDQPYWRARHIATAPPLRPFALVAGGPL
jgi:hypothetical protein